MFELVEQRDLSMADGVYRFASKPHTGRSLSQGHTQVALFTLLLHRTSGRLVLVSCTHIVCAWKYPELQLRQLVALTRFTEELLEELRVKYNNRPISLLICGDFNLGPASPLYEYMLRGVLPITDEIVQRASARGADRFLNNPDGVSHSLNLDSAYRTVLGAEPRYTNFKPTFKDCLDYVWFKGGDSLRPVAVLAPPSDQTLAEENGGIPSRRFPSDHIPIMSRFRWL